MLTSEIMETADKSAHESVLLGESLEFLLRKVEPERTLLYFDGTIGGGGHGEALLQRLPQAFLLAMDQDQQAINRASERLRGYQQRVRFVRGNFGDLSIIVPEIANDILCAAEKTAGEARGEAARELEPRSLLFDGMIVDLGVSFDQLLDDRRGFSFLRSGPLDMRMDQTASLTAETILNTYSFLQLKRVFQNGGLPRQAAALANAIIQNRPMEDTLQLAALCESTVGKPGHRHHAATVPFQALRIEVNDEFGSLRRFLNSAPGFLQVGGRLVVISFHSLEDKIVTRAMRSWSRGKTAVRGLPETSAPIGKLLTPKAVIPSEEEQKRNRKARSARMRVFEKSHERMCSSSLRF